MSDQDLQSQQNTLQSPPGISPPAAEPSRRVLVLFALILCGLLVAVAELGARFAGVKPWMPENPGVTVSPINRFFQKAPVLGWKHLPGHFDVTLRDGYTFQVNHTSDTLRITRPVSLYTNDFPTSPSIWILGCSMTHGWSVNDEETYPYLLQEQMPQYEIANFGCSGYGVLQNVMQLREALKTRRKPVAAILAYSSFLDERSTFTRNRRKNAAPWNSLGILNVPYARLNGNDIEVAYTPLTYTPFPLMSRSAFIHLLENAWNRFDEKRLQSHRVNEILVRQFALLCKENGIVPALALIQPSVEGMRMMEYCRELDMPTDGIAPQDINDRTDYVNLPHDIHPSPLLHRVYAQNMKKFLTGKVLAK